MNYWTKVASLLFALIVFVLATNVFFYKREQDSYRNHLSYTLSVKNDQINSKILEMKSRLTGFKNDLAVESFLNEEQFLKYAKSFLHSFPRVFAFNFIDFNLEIKYIYPKEKNISALGKNLKNHPDPNVAKVVDNLSREKAMLTGPIDIYQGGKAFIIYSPVQFKDGSYGWFNILVKVESLVEDLLQSDELFLRKVSIVDNNTGNLIYGAGSEESVVVLEDKILDKQVGFLQDFDEFDKSLTRTFINVLVIQLLILVLVGVLLSYYFKNEQEKQDERLRLTSEKNILRIIFHDLANPMLAIAHFFKKSEEKYGEDKKFKSAKRKVDTVTEILSSIRDLSMSSDQVSDEKFEIYWDSLIMETVKSLDREIEEKKLNLRIENKQKRPFRSKIQPEVVKNQMVANLMRNSIDNANDRSDIVVKIGDDELKIVSVSEKIPKDVLKQLNSTQIINSENSPGHGFGHYISSIIALNLQMQMKIDQDPNNRVELKMSYKS
tara:strand:- start:8267 stop:9745 length:1479 start_codon:yes stop_codon:yes gene_type:complete